MVMPHNTIQIHIASIIKESIVDGPGIRLAVFFQGCPHNCPGCHNPHTHPMDGGSLVSIGSVLETARRNPLLRGITLSGGEPFMQASAAATLASAAKSEGLDVVTYTGYTLEQLVLLASEAEQSVNDNSTPHPGIDDADPKGHLLPDTAGIMALLRATDILIDGPYIETQRTLDAPFKGSSNQRIIDVSSTIAANYTIVPAQFK